MEPESTSGPYNPRLQEGAQNCNSHSSDSCVNNSDSLDRARLMSVDHRERIGDMDGSQLVGDALVAIGGGGGCAVAAKDGNGKGASEIIAGKRRRGRPPRNQVKAAPLMRAPQRMKKDEEDVCFICFDGGSLVLCDRRGCPKAYHPACIKRDESFFRSKAKWNCGWHICSTCRKASHYMCYTCTYSLCKGCTKDADFVCVRGNKGFCGTCMRTIMLIENIALGNKEVVQVDFDDQTSWEYLFKVYWISLKEKLSLTLDELIKARNPWKGAAMTWGQSAELSIGINAKAFNMEMPRGDPARYNSKRRKIASQQDLLYTKEYQGTENSDVRVIPSPNGTTWATKELLEFVAHMKNGDASVLSHLDVQSLLLEYISRNNLCDPCQKSQIMCDARLLNLFGKARLGHFEMLKLLESHFLNQGSQSAIIRAGVVETVSGQLAVDGNNSSQLMMVNDKRCKTQKKVDDKEQQENSDEYAAIDVHNVNLIFLKRDLIENLLDDANKLHETVVGSFVRIKIPDTEQKGDLYRLVQVVGTRKVTDSYKVGTKTTSFMLEVLNLGKQEVVSVDGVSNQGFTEDECVMLRRSIKSGLIKWLTIGEVQEKAMALQAVRVNHWLESEILRPNHPCDRASENGRRKEHREFVEKLQTLTSPEEHQRRLSEVPEVHADPSMNPSYESEENDGENAGGMDEKRKDDHGRLAEEKKLTPALKKSDVSNDTKNEEDIAQSHPAGIEPSIIDGETDKIWLYQDSYGKTQGPLPWMMLRRWSIDGHFPLDLRIWRTTEKQDNSILLTDALNGQFHRRPELLYNGSLPNRDLIVGFGAVKDEYSWGRGEMNAKQRECEKVEARWNPLQNDSSGHCIGNSEFGSQSSATSINVKFGQVQTRNLLARWDLFESDKHLPNPPQMCSSQSSSAFSGKPCEALIHKPIEGQGVEGLDSNLSKVGENFIKATEGKIIAGREREGNPERQSCFVSLANPLGRIGFLDLSSTILESSREDLKVRADMNNKPLSSNIPVQESGPCGSTTSSLVGGPLLQEVAGNWGGYSPTPPKTSPEEWGSNLMPDSSMKPSELASDYAATPSSGSGPMMQPSPTHPATSASDWQAIVTDPDDFSSLVDESVSDLLAEVEAMEALRGLASHNSTMHSSECFSPALSPAPDLGKSDALSSTTDLRMPSQSIGINEPIVVSQAEAFECRRNSAGNSSTSAEADEDNRPSDVSVNQCKNYSNLKPSPPPPTSWGMASRDTAWSAGSETTSVSCGVVQGNEHIYQGLSQVTSNPGWDAGHGTAHENPRMNQGNYVVNPGYWPSQLTHSGTRERDFETRDSSSSRNRPFWNRQSYGGPNGVYSSRALPKGQRVCKFYESG